MSGSGAATLSSRYENAVFIEGVGTWWCTQKRIMKAAYTLCFWSAAACSPLTVDAAFVGQSLALLTMVMQPEIHHVKAHATTHDHSSGHHGHASGHHYDRSLRAEMIASLYQNARETEDAVMAAEKERSALSSRVRAVVPDEETQAPSGDAVTCAKRAVCDGSSVMPTIHEAADDNVDAENPPATSSGGEDQAQPEGLGGQERPESSAALPQPRAAYPPPLPPAGPSSAELSPEGLSSTSSPFVSEPLPPYDASLSSTVESHPSATGSDAVESNLIRDSSTAATADGETSCSDALRPDASDARTLESCVAAGCAVDSPDSLPTYSPADTLPSQDVAASVAESAPSSRDSDCTATERVGPPAMVEISSGGDAAPAVVAPAVDSAPAATITDSSSASAAVTNTTDTTSP